MTDRSPTTEGRTPCRIQWRDSEAPWTERAADWYGSRVPVAGDYIDLGHEGTVKVNAVMWGLDGTCIVRMQERPR